ncbi:MAG: DNA polymerase I [Eggerthellaceae bacterium]|nr:DNA polymerase I [Eggerthellaceae bacterium]
MVRTIAVIDGNSLMHRAFHAVPPTMNAADGTPTNAVFGFMNMLLKFVEVSHPDGIVCAFDAGKPKWRTEALEKYKAQRPPMDPALRVQFPVMEELLGAIDIPVVKVEGWEGDDVLGTVSARCEELGYRCLLVSGDKDVYQLVSDLTHVVTTKKGISDIEIYGPDEVFERYGVSAGQFSDYLGLMGDSSDNIPGVPGIGPKNASSLLQRFGSLDGIYDHLDELSGKQLENLKENRESAYLSREVATIVRDLDFELDLEAVNFPAYEAEAARAGFMKYQMNSISQKLAHLVGKPISVGHPSNQSISSDVVFDLIDADEATIKQSIQNDELVGVSFGQAAQASLFSSGAKCVVAGSFGVMVFEEERAFEMFAHIVKHARFTSNGIKESIRHIYPADSKSPAMLEDKDVLNMRGFDTAIAAYILNSSAGSYASDAVWDKYAPYALPEVSGIKKAIDEDARDLVVALANTAVASYLLMPILKQALANEGGSEVFERVDMPLTGVLAIMERTGAAIDVDRLKQLGVSTQEKLSALEREIYEQAGEAFNIDSPKQLEHILFEVMGFRGTKKTKTGYSTDAGVLKELKKYSDFPDKILRYRELAKIKSTYIDALPKLTATDGRIHTTFNQTVTTTGRLSSSDPNLQNIPVRTDFGRMIRECFVPLEDGSVFMSADYSQIELRLLAHLSKDRNLIDAFCSGADFHAQTAALIFGMPVDQVTPSLRSKAKAVNFGIVYGQQAYGLSQSLDIPFYEAQSMIDGYFAAYPSVAVYLKEAVNGARSTGYAVSMFGRRRYIPELSSGNPTQRGFGERTAMNHPMQGSAADIIKLAMTAVQRMLIEEGYKAKLLLQVHDELDFSVPADEVEKLSASVARIMSEVAHCEVPLEVDVETGETWAQSH